MPGYGTLPANEGTGLLPWSQADGDFTGSPTRWEFET